jgi:SepF-like predicted cell division protein (DUF552 family)
LYRKGKIALNLLLNKIVKKASAILALIVGLLCNPFILAEDVSEILNSIKIKIPDQKSESQEVGLIETEALQSKETNSEHESTSIARIRTSKEVSNALNSTRDGEVIVASYKAHLSAQDHFSSNGSRLSNAAAVIRQDRANFHKFGLRDAQDKSDDFFANASNREALEQMLNRGNMNPILSQEIINGRPIVIVKVIRTSTGSYYIQVESTE